METTTYILRSCEGMTTKEILEDFGPNHTPIGNDIDLLGQVSMLVQAGHYREAMQMALLVQPVAGISEELPEQVDYEFAKNSYLAASERARHLYEQTAFQIEGKVEGSVTMDVFDTVMAQIRASKDRWG